MAGTAKLNAIVEGRTTLTVPGSANVKGPASKAGVFYNPAMRTNRDITVLFGKVVARDGWKYLDALGGTGAKGIRLAVESGVRMDVSVNDKSPSAHEAICRNIAANGLENATASCMDYNEILSNSSFDWIDIDPYGSPVRFLDLGIQRLARGGILSITATDTAPLCGAKPEACLRRYMARPMRSSCSHELGLRILVGNTVRRAAAFDIALEPVFCYYHGHYFRAYLRMRKGAGAADDALDGLGYVSWDDEDGYAVTASEPLTDRWAGPLWISRLWDRDIVRDMLEACDESMSKETVSLLRKVCDEMALPPYFYDVDDMASLTRTDPMANTAVLEGLRDAGFEASGVHFSPKGFKTDAGFRELREIFNNASR